MTPLVPREIRRENSSETLAARSLEDAIYAVVHESAGTSPKQLAAAVGMRVGYLLNAANPHNDDLQLQARWIVPLTKASGNDAIVRHLAEEVGGMFVRLEPSASSDAHTARTLKEVADYLNAIADTHADGVVTLEEAHRARREANDVIEALLAHVSSLFAQARESKPVELRSVAR